MPEIPENVDLQWIARHLVDFRDEMRTVRADLDKLIAIVRQMRDELDVQGGAWIRIERRLDRIENRERERP